jgi:hypothetical protein
MMAGAIFATLLCMEENFREKQAKTVKIVKLGIGYASKGRCWYFLTYISKYIIFDSSEGRAESMAFPVSFQMEEGIHDGLQ